jgi:hypothetical protein
MKKIFFNLSLIGIFLITSAFCGFYVAKADAKLFNKTSQVIIVRQDARTVVTMASDFEGDVKDFAMVVPVPQVPTREMIRVAEADLFDKLDAYSGPRLVEYHDEPPCGPDYEEYYDSFEDDGFTSAAPEEEEGGGMDAQTRVTVKARYTVGEYDIVILEAEESNGLVKWLKANEYRLPAQTERLLSPYIKNGMYFFVVKVNLAQFEQSGKQDLRPIQMTYETDRFMLPIRLGMANAQADQDMLVYAFSDRGRVECTNYQTLEIPTDHNIPTFVADTFGAFYQAVFEKAWKEAGENVIFTEYSWDLSGSNFTKCDPCATTPPSYAELREAGVFWVNESDPDGWGGADYEGELHFTRLHVRYRGETFPQDLQFQATPDQSSFQGRYVMQQPVAPESDFSCEEGQAYLQNLISRRRDELATLAELTGWDASAFADYPTAYRKQLKGDPWFTGKEKRNFWWGIFNGQGPGGWFWGLLLLGAMAFGLGAYRRKARMG